MRSPPGVTNSDATRCRPPRERSLPGCSDEVHCATYVRSLSSIPRRIWERRVKADEVGPNNWSGGTRLPGKDEVEPEKKVTVTVMDEV